MDPLSVTAGIIAILQVTVKVCEGLSDAKDASIDRIKFTTETRNLSNLLVTLLSHYDENSAEPWHANIRTLLGGKDGLIQQYRSALEQLRQKIQDEHGIKKITKILLWKYVKDDAEQILSRVERLKSAVQIALQMDHLKLSQAIEAGVVALQDDSKILKQGVLAIESRMVHLQDDSNITKKGVDVIQEDQNRQRHRLIMDWLSVDDFPAQHSDLIGRRQADTGLWFLDSSEFTEWVNGTSKTLFCPGIPGAGKTIMAATVVDHLLNTVRSPDVGVAYVYCNYKRQAEQTVQYLLAALLKQLVHDRPSLARPLSSLYDNHQNKGTKLSLKETLSALKSALASHSTVYVVIDALDECPTQGGTRKQLLKFCRELQEQADMRLMATSRHISEIVEEFKDVPSLEVRASDSDVKRYVAGQIEHLARCVTADAQLQELVENKVVAAVDGMFLLARLHVDSLKDKRTKAKVRSALENLSTGTGALDAAYSEAIIRIDGQPQGDRVLAKNVLSWISGALRPLTTGELCHALSIKEGDEELDSDDIPDVEDILSVCAGLVTVEEESQIVRLVHYTTQDYLESIRETWTPKAQYDIASACLTYLCFTSFKSGACLSGLQRLRRLAEYKFLDYSARHWHQHVAPFQRELSALAMVLLQDNLRVACVLQTKRNGSKHVYYLQDSPNQEPGLVLAIMCGLLILCEELLCWAEKEQVTLMDARDAWGRTPLMLATAYGLHDIVKLLLDKDKANVDARTIFGGTLLMSAAHKGYYDIAKLLLDTAKADVNASDHGGSTPLIMAAKRGHEEVVKMLLSFGADVEAMGEDERTPLIWAAWMSHPETVKILLCVGNANVEANDHYGYTALHYAAEGNCIETVNMLLSIGEADVEAKDNQGRTPLLIWAKIGKSEGVAELLLTAGANIEAKDEEGLTPLAWATHNGNTPAFKMLLSKGADIEAKEEDGFTPLMWAACHGHTSAMRMLLNKGADIEAKEENGFTPLMWAACHGHTPAVRMLLNKGADIEAKEDDGQTSLMWAAGNGHTPAVKMLLGKGANIEAEDEEGLTPLIWVARNGRTPALKVLLSKGADIKATDEHGFTPLMWAAWNGHTPAVKILLSQGAGVEAKGNVRDGEHGGWTPLMMAAYKGHKKTVKVLLNIGRANIEAQTDWGNTVLDTAIYGRQEGTFDLLQRYGAQTDRIYFFGAELFEC